MAPYWWVGRTRGLSSGRCRRRWTSLVFRVPDRLLWMAAQHNGAASLRRKVPGPDPRGARPPTQRRGPLTTRVSLLPLGTDICPYGRIRCHLGQAYKNFRPKRLVPSYGNVASVAEKTRVGRKIKCMQRQDWVRQVVQGNHENQQLMSPMRGLPLRVSLCGHLGPYSWPLGTVFATIWDGLCCQCS